MFAWMNNQNIQSDTSRTTALRLLTPVIFSKNSRQDNSSDSTQEDLDRKSNVSLSSLVSLIEETVSESVLSLSLQDKTEYDKPLMAINEPNSSQFEDSNESPKYEDNTKLCLNVSPPFTPNLGSSENLTATVSASVEKEKTIKPTSKSKNLNSFSNKATSLSDVSPVNSSPGRVRNNSSKNYLTGSATTSTLASPINKNSSPINVSASTKNSLGNSSNSNEEVINNLTAVNPHVVSELKAPWILASDIESISCPANLHQFRKAWWAGVRPTTCERTCRHRSKVCDAIQLCNDCTGYYCKWLAELIGIPVLKANGRVDPLIFHKDPLAKLYWERISKVVCCPKSTTKCLMCIRRYQLFTHFLPGNLLFRDLVHRSVMRLHECGFSVDMGLIRKVTRRHLERISDTMNLKLPSEYYSSLQAYNIILQRGSLVDVLTNNLSSVLSMQRSSNDGSMVGPMNNYRKSNNSGYYSPHKNQSKQQNALVSSSSSSTMSFIGSEKNNIQNQGKLVQTDNVESFIGSNYDSKNETIEKTNLEHIQELTYDPALLADLPTDNDKYRKVNRNQNSQLVKSLYNLYISKNNEENFTTASSTTTEEEYNSNKFLSNSNNLSALILSANNQSTPLLDYIPNTRRILRSMKRSYVEDAENEEESDNKSGIRKKRVIRKPKIYLDYAVDQTDILDDSQEQPNSNVSSGKANTRSKMKKNGFQKSAKLPQTPTNNTATVEEPINDKVRVNQEVFHNNVLEQVAAALLRLIGSGREKKSAMMQIYRSLLKVDDEANMTNSNNNKNSMDESLHTTQLNEENRLALGGFRGIFWEPVREAWCTLLPMVPTDNVVSSRRKILSFSVHQWGSFKSAMWRAVYERVSRNIEELEYVNVSLLEELALWVKFTLNRTDHQQLNHLKSDIGFHAGDDQTINNVVYSNENSNDMFINFSNVLTSLKPQEII